MKQTKNKRKREARGEAFQDSGRHSGPLRTQALQPWPRAPSALPADQYAGLRPTMTTMREEGHLWREGAPQMLGEPAGGQS